MVILLYIKSFSLIISSVYLYKKLLNIRNSIRFGVWADVLFSLLLALMICTVNDFIQPFRLMIIAFAICGFVMCYYFQAFKISIVTSFISIGFAYLLGVIGGLLAHLGTFIILGDMPDNFSINILFYATAGVFQIFLIKALFYIQRLKKGMPFLRNEKFVDVGVIISFVLMGCTIFNFKQTSATQFYILLALICGIVLLLWWLNQLQVTYRERHSAQVEVHLENEIAGLREANDDLRRKNYDLSRLIHADNKLIPALELAYRQTLEAAVFPDAAQEQTARATLAFIESASSVRSGALAQYDIAHNSLTATGVPAVDVIVRYMAQRASGQGVGFQLMTMGSVKYLTDQIIAEYDLSTLLADLLENALIAVKDAEQKNILLSIGIVDGAYIIAVYDSGAAFCPDVIRRMGLERVTSHEPDGGSGIGLMTTFEILRGCEASFVLDETIDNSLYTKSVSICFDGMNQIKVRSGREEILSLSAERNDIAFFREQMLIGDM